MMQFARQLRREATPAERKLWRLLSEAEPRFIRQVVVGRYIVDIAHRPTKLAIELDSAQHVDNAGDEQRTAWLEGLGWLVLRFWNNDVLSNPEGAAQAVLDTVAQRMEQQTLPRPLPYREGRSTPHQPRTLGSSHE